eukprot:4090075-Prymnesium_polylepis.1
MARGPVFSQGRANDKTSRVYEGDGENRLRAAAGWNYHPSYHWRREDLRGQRNWRRCRLGGAHACTRG